MNRLGFGYAAEQFGGKVLSNDGETVKIATPEGELTFKGGEVVSAPLGFEDLAGQIAAMASAPGMKNPTILAVSGGFYFFGDLDPLDQVGPDGTLVRSEYATLRKPAMFGGFAGGKGLPGVARGDSAATVTLDRFDENQVVASPLFSGATLAIMSSINLYGFKGTTCR